MKILKILLAVVLVLVLLVVGAVAYVLVAVDPNDYKDQIAEAVREQTGRTLSFDGDLAFTLFPWIGLETGGLALSNAEGFTAETFAKVDAVQVSVKLLPLLSKNLEMRTLTLSGLTLNLEKRKDGRTNWQDLAEAGAAGEQAQDPDSGSHSGGGAGLAAFAIGGVEILDANVSYADRQAGTEYAVSGLNLTTGPILPGRATEISLDVTLTSSQPQLAANVSLAAEVLARPEGPSVEIRDLDFRVDADGAAVPGGEASLTATGDLEYDGAAGTASLTEFVLGALDATIRLDAQATGLNGNHAYTGTITLEELSPKRLMASLGQPALETADPDALTSFAARLPFSGGTNSLTMEGLSMQLDQSTLTGSLSLPDIKKQALRFDLALDTLNADRYLPPAKKSEAEPTQEAAEPSDPTKEPDLAALGALDIDGTFRAGTLTLAKATLTDVLVALKASSGVVRVEPFKANLYEGSAEATIRLDARQSPAGLVIKKTVKNVKAGPLMQDVMGNDLLAGTASINADLTTRGLAPDTAKKNLNGSLSFSVDDGAINGVNIPKMIRDAQTRLTGGTPDPTKVERTDFSTLTGTATVKNGLVNNPDLLLKSPLLRLNGKGLVNLPEDSLDYSVTAALAATLQGQGGKERDELTDVPVPLRIHGPLAKPSYTLDVKELARQIGLSKLGESLGGGMKDAGKGIGDILGAPGKDEKKPDLEKTLKNIFN